MLDLKAITVNKVITSVDKNGDLIVEIHCSYNLTASGNLKTLAEMTAHQKTPVSMSIEPDQLGLKFTE